jgi:DNA-binding NarL/FixJ family response regulator
VKTSVAIVEDDARTRETLRALIESTAALECAGEYASGEAALAGIPAHCPGVVLMDIGLPGLSGVETVARLKMKLPGLLVLMLMVYEDDDMVFQALRAGANGYLLKRRPAEAVLEAIQEVIAGGAPMSSSIARRVVQSFYSPRGLPGGQEPHLTPREEEVLNLVARGLINKEIAAELGLGLETVRSYLKSIYDKLHAHGRAEAVAKSFREGGVRDQPRASV